MAASKLKSGSPLALVSTMFPKTSHSGGPLIVCIWIDLWFPFPSLVNVSLVDVP